MEDTKYYLIYKTDNVHVKTFNTAADVVSYLLKLKEKNIYNKKFKYKIVWGASLCGLKYSIDYVFKED